LSLLSSICIFIQSINRLIALLAFHFFCDSVKLTYIMNYQLRKLLKELDEESIKIRDLIIRGIALFNKCEIFLTEKKFKSRIGMAHEDISQLVKVASKVKRSSFELEVDDDANECSKRSRLHADIKQYSLGTLRFGILKRFYYKINLFSFQI